MKYIYFVVAIGRMAWRTEVSLDAEITCMKQIEAIEDKLREDYGMDALIVTGWQLLRTEPSVEQGDVRQVQQGGEHV